MPYNQRPSAGSRSPSKPNSSWLGWKADTYETLRPPCAKRAELVSEHRFPNRSLAIQEAVDEKLGRLSRNRLAQECAKLDPDHERALAEEGMGGELAEWPEY